MGQKSGHNPGASFALGFLSGCSLIWRIDQGRTCFPVYTVGRIHSFESCWTHGLSSLVATTRGHTQFLVMGTCPASAIRSSTQEPEQQRVTDFCNLSEWHPTACAMFYSLEASLLDSAHTQGDGITKDVNTREQIPESLRGHVRSCLPYQGCLICTYVKHATSWVGVKLAHTQIPTHWYSLRVKAHSSMTLAPMEGAHVISSSPNIWRLGLWSEALDLVVTRVCM